MKRISLQEKQENDYLALYRLPEEKHLLLEDIREWCRKKGKLPFDVPVEYLRNKVGADLTNACAVYYSNRPFTLDLQNVHLVGLEKFVGENK